MTDLGAVIGALVEQLAADPLVGLSSAEDVHLNLVTSEAEWYAGALMPAVAVCVTEVERAVIDALTERTSVQIELHATLDGAQGKGSHAAVWTLGESLRRFLTEHRFLASGNPPVALVESGIPRGETYEVASFGERGPLQTAVVRWDATWLSPRTFDDVPFISARYLRTLTLIPGVGVDEDQPSPVPVP